MKKLMFLVVLDGLRERVLASNIFEAISKAKKLSNKSYKKCTEVSLICEVYFSGKLKPINQIYKVNIDHKILSAENATYYVISRGVTFAAQFAMKIHSRQTALTPNEQKGLFVVSVDENHILYNS